MHILQQRHTKLLQSTNAGKVHHVNPLINVFVMWQVSANQNVISGSAQLSGFNAPHLDR